MFSYNLIKISSHHLLLDFLYVTWRHRKNRGASERTYFNKIVRKHMTLFFFTYKNHKLIGNNKKL